MINDLIQMDVSTYDGLFPDLPFKKREEWADALIKKIYLSWHTENLY